jgi:UDPglucose--hexose-1-phosphate uridylyltransferase
MSIHIYEEIERLIQYGLQKNLIEKWDVDFVRNGILDILGLKSWEQPRKLREENLDNPSPILERILDWANEQKLLQPNTVTNRDLLDTKIMGYFCPRPSELIGKFNYILQEEGPKKATDFFYQFSQDVHYIRKNRINKNMHWVAQTSYGPMEITINLSKPEKDPRDIAAGKLDVSNYPDCVLCKENVGYAGRSNHPARQNLRVIPIQLNGEEWYFQYSPYVYYHQHAIIFAEEHRPMKIAKETFERLLSFLDQFPHFFIGSNADLPIVGGSILSHDHYQGGEHEFPMAKAKIIQEVPLSKHPKVKAGIVQWPMSVIRLQGKDKQEIVAAATNILEKWRNYQDESVGIVKESNGQLHNTITPIARMRGELYEMDLVLRNNRTSDEHPLGIFHPHEEVHHIKKENIGLIEVMGLAVLPGRLKEELEKLAAYYPQTNFLELMEKDEATRKHMDWGIQLKERYGNVNHIEDILRDELGQKFVTVLEHSAVFKKDMEGLEAFQRFCQHLNEKLR